MHGHLVPDNNRYFNVSKATTNAKNHIRADHRLVEDVHAKRWNPEVKKGPMDSHLSNNVPNLPGNLREAIVTMIINAGLSFTFAENPDFINVVLDVLYDRQICAAQAMH